MGPADHPALPAGAAGHLVGPPADAVGPSLGETPAGSRERGPAGGSSYPREGRAVPACRPAGADWTHVVASQELPRVPPGDRRRRGPVRAARPAGPAGERSAGLVPRLTPAGTDGHGPADTGRVHGPRLPRTAPVVLTHARTAPAVLTHARTAPVVLTYPRTEPDEHRRLARRASAACPTSTRSTRDDHPRHPRHAPGARLTSTQAPLTSTWGTLDEHRERAAPRAQRRPGPEQGAPRSRGYAAV